MFNLLPKDEKDAVRREYRTRLTVVALSLLFVTFLIGAAVLAPSLFLTRQKEKSASTRFEVLTKSVAASEAAHIDETLRETRDRLTALSREKPRLYLYELVSKISSPLPAGISLDGVSVGEAREGKREVLLRGRAESRIDLAAFSHFLEDTGLFEEVKIPVSNFAKDADIPFAMNARMSL